MELNVFFSVIFLNVFFSDQIATQFKYTEMNILLSSQENTLDII